MDNSRVTPPVVSCRYPPVAEPHRALPTVILMLTVVLVAGVAADYRNNWFSPETVALYYPPLMRCGPAPGWRDFLLPFDIRTFEGPASERVRIVATAATVASCRLRWWLWQYLPPHPSFSLTWLTHLLLVPTLFWLALRRMADSASAATVGLACLLVSPGFLSTFIFTMNAAKPLMLAFFVMVLYLGTCTAPRARWLLPATVTAALFTDEYGLVLWVLTPSLAPMHFRRPARRNIWLTHGLTLAIFISAVTWLLPAFTAWQFGYSFAYWEHVSRPENTDVATTGIRFIHFVYNTYRFGASHLIPFALTTTPNIQHGLAGIALPFEFGGSAGGWWAAWLLLAGGALALSTSRRRLLLRRFLPVTLLAIAGFGIINTHHLVVLPDSFYYGSPLSIFFAAFAGLCWPQRRGPVVNVIAAVAILVLVVVLFTNALACNRYWLVEWNHGREPVLPTAGRVITLWRHWRAGEFSPPPSVPHLHEWLYSDLAAAAAGR